MKVNFLSQIDPFQANGGGEMVIRELITAGRDHGLDIRVSAAWPEAVQDLSPDADLYILADIFNQPSVRKRLDSSLIDDIIRSKPYIHLDNAYVDVCDLPYLPCNGAADGQSCAHKKALWPMPRRLLRRGCLATRSSPLYANSLLNVFVSPLHRERITSILGEEIVGKSFILRPTVDTAFFRNLEIQRDIGNLFVGAVTEAKGLDNMRAMFPDGDILMIGPSGRGDDGSFGQRIGRVDYENVPGYMNRAENFVFLPRWPEPMGRVVVEAALCGCNLITNDNVGATSFDFDITDPCNLEGAVMEFWETVEQLPQSAREAFC